MMLYYNKGSYNNYLHKKNECMHNMHENQFQVD